MAAVLGAAAMLLLPAIYGGLIIGWAWLVLRITGVLPSREFRWIKEDPVLPIGVLIMGGIVLLFMIKPLFHARKKPPEQREARREQEPCLFALIDAIADALGAPRPRRVVLDLQANASAGFTRGLRGLFSRNLTLTICLPLAGALSVQGLGGVIAHELGHFRQRGGMTAYALTGLVNAWLHRVVYERDTLDELLAQSARLHPVFIFFSYVTLVLVAIIRSVLRVLMLAGRLISLGLSRQMEFDADRAEVQIAGSAAFVETTLKLRSLRSAMRTASEKQEAGLKTGRLVDDLPGLIRQVMTEAQGCEESVQELLASDEKPGWFQTHPTDRDRARRALDAQCEGILRSSMPGPALFGNFAALSRQLTAAHYQDALNPRKGRVQLISLDELAAEDHGARREEMALDRFFGGCLVRDGLKIFLTPSDLPADTSLEEWKAVNRSMRGRASAMEFATAMELRNQLQREHALRRGIGLSDAWVEWTPTELKLASTAEAPEALTSTQREVARLEMQLAPLRTRLRERMASAIGALLCQESRPAELKSEARRCIATLKFIEESRSELRVLAANVPALDAIFEHLSRSGNPGHAAIAFQRHTDALREPMKKLLERSRAVAFPLPHGRGRVMMNEYLSDDVWHGNPLNLGYLRGKAAQDRIESLYRRVLARLAQFALEEEKFIA